MTVNKRQNGSIDLMVSQPGGTFVTLLDQHVTEEAQESQTEMVEGEEGSVHQYDQQQLQLPARHNSAEACDQEWVHQPLLHYLSLRHGIKPPPLSKLLLANLIQRYSFTQCTTCVVDYHMGEHTVYRYRSMNTCNLQRFSPHWTIDSYSTLMLYPFFAVRGHVNR